jgi:hypothetical protein
MTKHIKTRAELVETDYAAIVEDGRFSAH